MKTEAVFVIESGTVTALAGGPLSLADMGPRKTKRASHLTFHHDWNQWVVEDAESGTVLYHHPDYDVALAWERTHYNRRLTEAI